MSLEIVILKEELPVPPPSPQMKLTLESGGRGTVYLAAVDELGQKWTVARITAAGIRLYNNIKNPAYPLDESGRFKIVTF